MTLPVTALTAAILAIMILLTAIATVRQRFKSSAAFGLDDANQPLVSAARSHGNLTEHAPMAVIMIALLEMVPVNHLALTGVAVLFLAARAAHIIGLHQPVLDKGPPPARALGVIGTWVTYIILIVWILFQILTRNA